MLYQPQRLSNPKSAIRRGAAIVELAIVLMVFLILVLGMIDLGLAILRQQLLSEASRQGVRQAIIHGKLAPSGLPGGGPWGPTSVDVLASSSDHPIIEHIRPFLIQMDHAQTRIQVEWPEGSNDIQKQVRVTVSTTYQPMITFIFGDTAMALTSSTTMPIAH